MKPRSLTLTLLDANWSEQPFPPVEMAWDEPNGLLAVGGDLSVPRLLNAYQAGIFPWFGPREPIYWWSPNPRAVLFPHKVHLTRSLRKSMRNKGYRITFDHCFSQVVQACAAPRSYADGTWITHEMHDAYWDLHHHGRAHSIEVWNAEQILVGGLYGVVTGGVFNGESMFSREPDTSKIAMVAMAYHLQQWGFAVIDCQILNSHLLSMGAEQIPRSEYLTLLNNHINLPMPSWQVNHTVDLSRWQP